MARALLPAVAASSAVIDVSHCSDDFEFRIEAVIPVGLKGEGQRPMHTNVIGRIARGSVKVGDLVLVPWTNGGWRPIAVKGLMTQHDAPDRFPEELQCGYTFGRKPAAP